METESRNFNTKLDFFTIEESKIFKLMDLLIKGRTNIVKKTEFM
jgi:hypothetical protein